MKTVNSISGGKTSAYIAANYPADYDVFALVRSSDESIKLKDRKLAQAVEDRIQKPFVGTLEDDIIINTIFDLEQFIGRRITWVSGDTFDDVIWKSKKSVPPSYARRYCTTEMKVVPIKEWWYKNVKEVVEMRIGFRANELNRAKNVMSKENEKGLLSEKFIVGKIGSQNKWEKIYWRKCTFPLINDSIFKDDVDNYWKDKLVRFAPINNCVGCFHASPLLLRKKWDWHPDKMEWFAKQEDKKREASCKFPNFREEGSYRDFKGNGLQVDLFPEDFGGNDGCESGYCGI